jgi:CTP synthase (UTP-ammonia lyase)
MAHREIVLIGERDLSKRAHLGIEASIALFQQEAGPALTFRWVSTAEVADKTPERLLAFASGIWCTPGSPYESTAGALEAIRYAREQRRPFLGTCGGFQHALMEFSKDVLGREAAHQEMDAAAKDPLIAKLACSLVGAKARVLAIPGTLFADLVGGESVEEFHCNYGMASAFEPAFADSNLKFIAYDDAKQVRAFQLENHPFFVGTLFQPERRALDGSLHPLVRAFLQRT